MRAVLLFTYPAGCPPDGTQIPAAPALLIEDENVGLFVSDWVQVFPGKTLETLNEQDIRDSLRLDDKVAVYLPAPRPVPDASLYSAIVSEWRQNWSQETARLLSKRLTPVTVS